jgi:peptidoglycan L-alanyl-D-glutamate endopeptidase CwlK
MLIKPPTMHFSARSVKNLQGIDPILARVMRIALQYALVPFAITESESGRHPVGSIVNIVALPAGVVSWEPCYYQLIADAVAEAAMLCEANVKWVGQSVLLQSTTQQECGHFHPA